MEKKIFEIEKMKEKGKFIIDVPEGADVRVGEVSFDENVVSKIEIFKFTYESTSLFLKVYAGHLKLAVVVSYTDYLMQIEDDKYYFRPTQDFDYPVEKKKES